jgi:hypothetical protein
MQRRSLLKLSVGAAVLLAVAGGGIAMLRPGLVAGRLSDPAKVIFAAVAAAVLDGSLPADKAQREAAIGAHLQRLESTLAGFPAATQAELSQLLALLGSAPGRLGLAGLHTEWPRATVAELQQSLQGMRTSSLAMRQQVYHALRDLTNAAYYADPASWSLLGYPGPQAV